MVITIGCLMMIYIIQGQVLISKRDYLEGMIEHHAMGIAMAKKFENIDFLDGDYYEYISSLQQAENNKEIEKLSRSIVRTQFNEIKLMDKLLTNMK